MSREQKCPIGSRWQVKNGARVFVVIERKPFGILGLQEEGRAYFGESRQCDFLLSFRRLDRAEPSTAQS